MKKEFRGITERIGPGVITGASDDDPSGILTYIQTGVVMGVHSLWVALVTLPLMYGIQEMCGRIGYVTDKGLVKLLKTYFPRFVLYPIVVVSVVVVTINIGADLLAISVVLEHLLGLSRLLWLPGSAALILILTILLPYRTIARIFKWLALTLLFYIATAFFIDISWTNAIRETLTPSFSFSKETLFLIAAVFGTTISPYLFFWQVNEEAEERDETVAQKHLKRFLVTKNKLRTVRKDTLRGMILSNVVMWFIILTASHLAQGSGILSIGSFEEASLVLRPLLGEWAYVIFALGIIGTGLLAVPVLAGSIGYMSAETFEWSEGLNKKFREARGFYWSIIAATACGAGLALLGINPVLLLIYTAVLYALITPILIAFILAIANSKKIMGNKRNRLISNILGGAALAITGCVSVAYVVSLLL